MFLFCLMRAGESFELLLWAKAKLSGAQLAFVRTYMGLSQDKLPKPLGLKITAGFPSGKK